MIIGNLFVICVVSCFVCVISFMYVLVHTCLGVADFSCHICSGGSYSRSGCREGICLPVLVQYHSKSNICSSFYHHHDDTGQ